MKKYENNPEVFKILAKLEKLEELRTYEVITEDEYHNKKIELLSQI